MAAKKSKYTIRSDGLHEAIRVINGKRVAFRGKTDAIVERKMIEYREKVEQGPLFQDVAEDWKEQHYPTLSPATAKGYNASYNRAVERFKNQPIKELKAQGIDALLQRLARQQYSRKVVATQRLVVNLICHFAVMEGIININPCTEVKVPKNLKHTPRELPSDEELEIVKKGWKDPGGLLPYFILYTGCRRGEALALTWKDINWKKKLITINKSVCYGTSGTAIKCPKTPAGTREVILLNKLAEVLPRRIGNDLIFPGPDGGFIKESTYQGRWNRWRTRVGVTLTAHQLRHGFATMLYEAEIPERDAMDLLGHSDIKLTHNIYTHIRKSRKETTATKLNQAAETF